MCHRILRKEMQAHLVATVQAGVMYSMPARLLSAEPLQKRLAEPQTERARVAERLPEHPCLDIESADVERNGSRVFFRLVSAKLGVKKVMRLPVGAGGEVSRGELVISLHRNLGTDAEPIVETRPASGDTHPDPGLVLGDVLGSIDDHEAELLQHRGQTIMWYVPDMHIEDGVAFESVSRVITAMV